MVGTKVNHYKNGYVWEEYAQNRFIRFDKEAQVWVTMEVHTDFEKRLYSQGTTKEEAKKALVSACVMRIQHLFEGNKDGN